MIMCRCSRQVSGRSTSSTLIFPIIIPQKTRSTRSAPKVCRLLVMSPLLWYDNKNRASCVVRSCVKTCISAFFRWAPFWKCAICCSMDSYRSLDAWKIANEATCLTYRSCDKAYQGRARSIFDQLRRAALSVEAECLLRVAGQLGYLPDNICQQLEGLLGRMMQMLRRLMRNPPAG